MSVPTTFTKPLPCGPLQLGAAFQRRSVGSKRNGGKAEEPVLTASPACVFASAHPDGRGRHDACRHPR
jgi:hypothetical protein